MRVYLNKILTNIVSNMAFKTHVFILDETCNYILDFALLKNKDKLFNKWNKSNICYTVFGYYPKHINSISFNRRININ